MIILIGGASHTGKTLLAQQFLEKYNYTFAKQLFDIPLPERYNWLRGQADELISTGKLSKKTVKCLNDAVEFFAEKDVR